jgi:hypothetical protein
MLFYLDYSLELGSCIPGASPKSLLKRCSIFPRLDSDLVTKVDGIGDLAVKLVLIGYTRC